MTTNDALWARVNDSFMRQGLMQPAYPKFAGVKVSDAPNVNRRQELAKLMTSGDNQQLARAMVKSPIILLLDEPTLGLDGHHRKLMLRAIDHIAANSDTRIIFVSHSAGEVPACINQHLSFEPVEDGFEVLCREQPL